MASSHVVVLSVELVIGGAVVEEGSCVCGSSIWMWVVADGD